ncbi:MAG: cell division protein FtsA [Bacteroidota bacterium]|nr:cell division protein FtsA [Bacteroidota bacterium]
MSENQKPLIVGLDIGTTKICAIVGRENDHGKIDILGMGRVNSDGVSRGTVANIGRTANSIREAIAIASQASNIEIKTAYVGIAGQNIGSFRHMMQIVRPNNREEISQVDIDRLEHDVKMILPDPTETIIEIIPQDYSIDQETNISDPIGRTGSMLTGFYHVITSKINSIENIDRAVRQAGIESHKLILEPIASGMSVLNQEEKESGVALIDIGGGTTDLAIYKDGIIKHTAIIPLGGKKITDDIAEACQLIYRIAEQLKVQHGYAVHTDTDENAIISMYGNNNRQPKEISQSNLAKVIQARMEEILYLIDVEIRCTGLKKKLHNGIVITGGGSQLKSITGLAELVLGLDARLGSPQQNLNNLGTTVDNLRNPMYATGIGLVMRGIEDSKFETQMSNTASTSKTKKTTIDSLIGKAKKLGKGILRDGMDIDDYSN